MSSVRFESPHDFDNVATFTWTGEGVYVSVSEEKAVDSYNDSFECSIRLTPDQFTQLRDWVNGVDAKAVKAPKPGDWNFPD